MFIRVLLPGSRRTHDGDELAAVDRQADLVQRRHFDLAHAVDLGQGLGLDDGAALTPSPSPAGRERGGREGIARSS